MVIGIIGNTQGINKPAKPPRNARIKNIKIGPTLPAFVSENVLKILIDKFGLGAISTPEKDIAEALKK